MTDNKRHLRDYGIALILFAILDLFTAMSSFLAGYFDGTFDKAFANVDPAVVTASKVVMAVLLGFWMILVIAEIFIGVKGITISANPSADKGYITAAKVFLVFNALGVLSYAVTIFNTTSATAFDNVTGLASATLSACAYGLFIHYATAVRDEFLQG